MLMQESDIVELGPQHWFKIIRQHRNAIFTTFTAMDPNRVTRKIEIPNPQAQTLCNTQPGAKHKTCW